MQPPKHIPEIEALASQFEDRVHANGANIAWGQFLDGPINHRQIGLYGTSSGLLVRALAKRGADSLQQQAHASLEGWLAPEASEYATLWPQTVRLAFAHLALRIAIGPDCSLTKRLAEELMRRRLPGGMWADHYSESGDSPKPGIVPSSMVILSFALGSESTPDSVELERQVEKLEDLVEATQDLSHFDLSLSGAALLSFRRKKLRTKIDKKLKGLALALPSSITDLGVYFYEYSPAGAGSGSSASTFPREYLILPTSLVAGIAGLLPGAPGVLRVKSYEIHELLLSGLKQRHAYRPTAEGRVSTLNQAWAALLLAYHASTVNRPWDLGPNMLVRLIRPRADTIFTTFITPAVSWLCAIVATVTVSVAPLGTWERIALATCALVVGGLYPLNKVLPRLVRRREW